jgi:hypothetical protein
MSTIRDLEGNVQKLGGGELLKVTHRLMSAEILGLVDTPVVLVPAEPGVMFIPMMAAGISPESGGDYSGGGDIAVTWIDSGGSWNTNNAPMHLASDLPTESGMVYITYPGDVSTNVFLNSRSDAVGAALALAVNFGQGFTGGASYVDVALWYTRWEIPA